MRKRPEQELGHPNESEGAQAEQQPILTLPSAEDVLAQLLEPTKGLQPCTVDVEYVRFIWLSIIFQPSVVHWDRDCHLVVAEHSSTQFVAC